MIYNKGGIIIKKAFLGFITFGIIMAVFFNTTLVSAVNNNINNTVGGTNNVTGNTNTNRNTTNNNTNNNRNNTNNNTNDTIDTKDNDNMSSDLLYGIGGVAVGGVITYIIMDNRTNNKKRIK